MFCGVVRKFFGNGRYRLSPQTTSLTLLQAASVWALTIFYASNSSAFPAITIGIYEGISSEYLVQKVAVFGEDNRVPVPSQLGNVKEGIGLLYDKFSQTRCTAFCAAPNVIATAAHCLFGASSLQKPKISDFYFRLEVKNKLKFSRLDGFQNRSSSQFVVTGTTRLQTHPPMNSPKDWSLVRLKSPICTNRSLEIAPQTVRNLIKASKSKQIFQIAYHWDYVRWKLAYSSPCSVKSFSGKLSWREIKRLFSSPEELVFHDCDTGGASSGSPILMKTENGQVVVGINVGSYEQIVTSSSSNKNKSQTKIIANTAVNASAFYDMTKILQSADVIDSQKSLKTLQAWLKADGFYKGQIDGYFGPLTRNAISSYQTARQLPATGLPTQSLLLNTITLGQKLPWLEDKILVKPASSNVYDEELHRSVNSKALKKSR